MTQQEEFEFRYRLEKEREMSASAPQQDAPAQSPAPQEQNILGKTFNVPGAAVRSAIKGTGYAYGAANPDKISSFREDAANIASDQASKLPRPLVAPSAFIGSSVGQLAGMVADTVTNPADILATLVGGKAVSAIAKTPIGEAIGSIMTKERNIFPTSEQLIAKAHKLTTEVLNPTKRELAISNVRGQTLPAVEQTAAILKKAKNFEEIGNQIDTAIKNTFTERNALLKADNYQISGDRYISNLKHEILRQERLGQSTPAEIMQMKQVLAREQAFVTSNGGKIDRLMAQERKEYLQNQTESLLIKNQAGKNISTDPARTRAMDSLRFGLKEAVEGGDKKIVQINSTYAGLKRARMLVAEQNALAQKAVKENLVGKIVHMVMRPQDAGLQTLQRARSLSSKTGKIESLIRRATK